MNGDLLTTLDYRAMWEKHNDTHSTATLATYQRDVKIDLGVVEIDDEHWVQAYIEKPTYHYTVSTGIYVFTPAVLEFIPHRQRMDLPELVLRLLKVGHRIATYPFDGYWLDIGRPDDYEQAIFEFKHHRSKFLPAE
jgi:NDP-sugar pyrophosphorylase family protein